MSTFRFDPDDDLTPAQLTQLFRDIYKEIPEEQVVEVPQTIAQYLKENE